MKRWKTGTFERNESHDAATSVCASERQREKERETPDDSGLKVF